MMDAKPTEAELDSQGDMTVEAGDLHNTAGPPVPSTSTVDADPDKGTETSSAERKETSALSMTDLDTAGTETDSQESSSDESLAVQRTSPHEVPVSYSAARLQTERGVVELPAPPANIHVNASGEVSGNITGVAYDMSMSTTNVYNVDRAVFTCKCSTGNSQAAEVGVISCNPVRIQLRVQDQSTERGLCGNGLLPTRGAPSAGPGRGSGGRLINGARSAGKNVPGNEGEAASLEEMVMALKDEQAEAREALYQQMKELHLEQGDMKRLMGSYRRNLQQDQTEIATVVECISTRQSAHYQEMAEYTQALRSNAQPPPCSQDMQCLLPPDALEFCLQIQTLIGGNMKRFARQMLGKSLGEGPDAPGFASTQEFWRLVETWVQESEPSDVSKAALQKACQGLHPSPLDDCGQPLQEMALVDRLRLERNFKRMRENMLMTPLVDELETSELLTEDARHFLLEERLPRSQRTARLCDVIISWGKNGLPALIRALHNSDQRHVAIELQKEPQQAALPEESTARQEQQSQAACPDTEASRPLTEEEQRFLEELENISRPASVQDLDISMKKQQDQLDAIAATMARLQADTKDRHFRVMQHVNKVFNEVHTDLRRGFFFFFFFSFAVAILSIRYG